MKISWVPVLKDMDVVEDLNCPKYMIGKMVVRIEDTLTQKMDRMNGCILFLTIS